MQTYLLKRSLMAIVVASLAILFLSFVVLIVPGDPARALLGPRASPVLIERIRAEMDLDRPAVVQAGTFLWKVIRGDLGSDVFTGRPIATFVRSALPHTLILAWASISLAVALAVPLGIISATHPGTWLDRITSAVSISFVSVPSFVVGLLLLLLCAVQLHLLPAIGAGELGNWPDYAKHLLLPTVTLALPWIGYLARLVRTSMLEVLNETYIRAAMASGLSRRLILYKYALKNALIPTVAVVGAGIGSLMSGAVIVEVIFGRPGMGTLIYQGILARNYPIVRAGVLIVALFFVGGNLLADLTYSYLDPRIRLGRM
jgi:peptide/nickel transport system permease protein